MKAIISIPIWIKGHVKQATILKSYGTNLQLNKSADFWYGLLDENQEVLASGSLTIEGTDYQEWDADTFAWDWIAEQLDLTIIGDYVSPTTSTTTTLEPTTTTSTTTEDVAID
jgi:hypothetical protein